VTEKKKLFYRKKYVSWVPKIIEIGI